MNGPHGLVLEEIEITLHGKRIVEIDERVAPGETLTVMGPSGSGKSTLLALVGGFLDPVFEAKGDVRLNGCPLRGVKPEKRRIGLLFQDALLFPHMSVGDNLLFALPASLTGLRHRRHAAEAMLEKVGLAGFLTRDPATLSGGQQARVALARTLLADPQALLLDEPFSRLDADRRQSVRDLVFGLVTERRIPALLVTHEREDAEAAGGKIVDIGRAGP